MTPRAVAMAFLGVLAVLVVGHLAAWWTDTGDDVALAAFFGSATLAFAAIRYWPGAIASVSWFAGCVIVLFRHGVL